MNLYPPPTKKVVYDRLENNDYVTSQGQIQDFRKGGGEAGYTVKDRQQEVWPVLLASRYNGGYYLPRGVQYMYHTYIFSLFVAVLLI